MALAAPWFVRLITAPSEQARPRTAFADALYAALERALLDRRSAIHRQTFGWYDRERGLATGERARGARIAS
jgi:hypothetical protein